MPKFLDNNGLLYFLQKLKTIFQLQEAGKGLSSNDFTSTYKNNVDANTAARHSHSNKSVIDGISSTNITNWNKAQANVIESVKVNGTALTVTSKAVDITVPTDNASLANGAGYAVATDVEAAYVKKETGKGLSTNDFTSTYKSNVDSNTSARHTHSNKTVLDGISSAKVSAWDSAQPNVIEGVKVNGTSLTPTSKVVDITVPTKVSALTNDTGFITKSSDITGNAATATKATQDASGNVITSTYAKIASPTFTGTPKAPTASEGNNSTQIATTAFVTKAISSAVGGITSISYQIVASLPETGAAGVIYLIAHQHGTSDSYDEYIWTGTAFEKIGNTDVDLSGYLKKTDMAAITNEEIDEICA